MPERWSSSDAPAALRVSQVQAPLPYLGWRAVRRARPRHRYWRRLREVDPSMCRRTAHPTQARPVISARSHRRTSTRSRTDPGSSMPRPPTLQRSRSTPTSPSTRQDPGTITRSAIVSSVLRPVSGCAPSPAGPGSSRGSMRQRTSRTSAGPTMPGTARTASGHRIEAENNPPDSTQHANDVRPRDDERLFRLEIAHQHGRIFRSNHRRQQLHGD